MRVAIRAVAAYAALVCLAPAARAVEIDWAFVASPANNCDPQSQGCFGTVDYGYYIGTYEITNAQYIEFLNAKAASDPLGLYNQYMDGGALEGGITRTGSAGSYTYSAVQFREDRPVNNVSIFDAMRFVNWLANGQANGDTETGAYTLLGGTATPSNAATVKRNRGALIFLQTENEWYKAAYYDAATDTFYDYPTSSNTPPTCAKPTPSPNSAACWTNIGAPQHEWYVGSYPNSPSPSGTFDQGGNVWEWNETIIGANRGARGGGYDDFDVSNLAASTRGSPPGTTESRTLGFRIAAFPEPSTPAGLLSAIGMLVLLRRRRS
jgi:formylglycine-generating enzyme required for sulfatase activity